MVDTELQEILAKEVEKLIANHGLAVPGRNPIDNPEIEEPYVKGDAIWKTCIGKKSPTRQMKMMMS